MYNKIQLVAYHSPTLLGSPTKKPAQIVPIPSAIKVLSNDDEKFRIQCMYQVVLWAATDPAVDTSATTLKVFLAPEFYFKTPGPSSSGGKRAAGGFGAYSHNTMINMLECLRTIFTSPLPGKPNLLKHWLIIPGTIVSDLPGDGKSYSAKASDNVYMNTAPVIQGEKDGFYHYIHKYFISGIDGPPEDASISWKGPYKTVLAKLKAKGLDEFDSYSFQVDNVSFAFDICLDHAKGVAKKTAKRSADVHLVTACGMGLEDTSVVAKAGGHAMICDGHPSPALPRSDVRTFNGVKLGPSNWNNPAALAGRKVVPKDLRIGEFAQVKKFEKGVSVGIVANPGGTGWMFPEEILWYKSVNR